MEHVGYDMDSWLVPVLVALISGPVVVLLQLLRRENTYQHGESRHLLENMVDKLDKVDQKIDHHIGWHDGIKETA